MRAMLTQAKPNRRIYNTPCDSVPMEESEGLVIGSLLLNISKILPSYISFVSYSALKAALSVVFEPSNACQHSVLNGLTVVYTGPPHLRGRRGLLLYPLSRWPTRKLWPSSRHPQSTAYFLRRKNNTPRKRYLLPHFPQDVFSSLSTLSEQQGRHCDRGITRNWCWNCFGVGKAWSQGKSTCFCRNMT